VLEISVAQSQQMLFKWALAEKNAPDTTAPLQPLGVYAILLHYVIIALDL